MNIFFGTDGIRGPVNKSPMDPKTILKIGMGIVKYFSVSNNKLKILIGYDTRSSAYMILGSLISGITFMGGNVYIAGVIPTSGISLLTNKEKFSLGISITASHNKFSDNGIKIFDSTGYKISNKIEVGLRRCIKGFSSIVDNNNCNKWIGKVFLKLDSASMYVRFLRKFYCNKKNVSKFRMLFDFSNGSASIFAQGFFNNFGLDCSCFFYIPNGRNVNMGCGSEYPLKLSNKVVNKNANIGFTFDGDGDRILVVSNEGKILHGEQLIAIFSYELKKVGFLKNKILVSSITSNSGLKFFLRKIGIRYAESEVGDKFVIKKMEEKESNLGGENSGHIIFSDYLNTGDGILSAIIFINILKMSRETVFEILRYLYMIPNYTTNITAKSKPNLFKNVIINKSIFSIKKKLDHNSKVLIRYSGTEPKCRVMIEGNNVNLIENYCKYISKIIFDFIKNI